MMFCVCFQFVHNVFFPARDPGVFLKTTLLLQRIARVPQFTCQSCCCQFGAQLLDSCSHLATRLPSQMTLAYFWVYCTSLLSLFALSNVVEIARSVWRATHQIACYVELPLCGKLNEWIECPLCDQYLVIFTVKDWRACLSVCVGAADECATQVWEYSLFLDGKDSGKSLSFERTKFQTNPCKLCAPCLGFQLQKSKVVQALKSAAGSTLIF